MFAEAPVIGRESPSEGTTNIRAGDELLETFIEAGEGAVVSSPELKGESTRVHRRRPRKTERNL